MGDIGELVAFLDGLVLLNDESRAAEEILGEIEKYPLKWLPGAELSDAKEGSMVEAVVSKYVLWLFPDRLDVREERYDGKSRGFKSGGKLEERYKSLFAKALANLR